MTTDKSALAPNMRDWLDSRPRTILFRDLVSQFVERFNLEAHQAGRLLALWARSL